MTEAQNPLTPSGVTVATPTTSNLQTPQRVLAIGAHPDDIDFQCGATLAKWASDGCEVSVLVCTDGSKGTWDLSADTDTLIAQRQDEQRAAAQELGVTGEIVFLGWPDGELASGLDQRCEIAYWIRKLKPNIVIGHDPWKQYRLHPDHRHAGWLTVDGLVAARDPKFFAEHNLAHHRPDVLLLFEAESPDHFEDVEGHLETKLAALMSHHSQFESTMKADGTPEGDGALAGKDLAEFRARMKSKLDVAGQTVGIAQAELFKLIDDL